MNNEEINYKTLRKIQQIEEGTSVLSDINPEIYQKFSEYIQNLNLRLKNETNNQKKIILINEINNTKKIIESIYNQREKKILLAIMSKVRGGNPNLKNLIKSEKILFDFILETVTKMRKQIFEKQIIKKSFEEEDNNKYLKNNDNNLIKEKSKIYLLKENIPEFIGTDEKRYNLRKDDIITLPNKISDLLLKRKVIKELKTKIY
jgi:DNA replication factor GINS